MTSELTNEEREQVVELLRCAAELSMTRACVFPIDEAATALFGVEEHEHGMRRVHPAFDLACHAVICFDRPCSTWQLLEVAQRVEEGSWP